MREGGLQHLLGLLLALGDGAVFFEGPGVQAYELGHDCNAGSPARGAPLRGFGKDLPGIQQAALGAGAAAQIQIKLRQITGVACALQQALRSGEDVDGALQGLCRAGELGLGQHGQVCWQAR